MDIGQTENPFAASGADKPIENKDNKTNPNAQKTGSGLFKIGDYDEPNSKSKNSNLAEQTTETVSKGLESVTNKLTGGSSNK